MRINPGTQVPDDVQSSVQIANDLGEQVVNLVPSHGGAVPALESGADVPAAPDQVPANVGAVVASATRLLQAIPAGNLNKLIGELATSLAGQAGNLRTLVSAGTTFSKEFVAYQQQFTELLANAPPSLDAITAVAPELRQDVANTAALVQVLAQQKTGLHTLLTSGSSAFNAVDNLLTSQSANLGLLPARQRRHPLQCRRSRPISPTCRRASPTTRTSSAPSTTSPSRGGQAHHERRGGDQSDVPAHPPALPAGPRRAGAVLQLGQLHPRHACPAPGASRRSAMVSAPATQPGLHARRRRPRGGAIGAAGRRRGRFGDTRRAGGERVVPRAGQPEGTAVGTGRAGGPGIVPGLGRPPLPPADPPAGLRDVPAHRIGAPGAVTHGGRTESHDHDRRDNGQRSEGGRCAHAGRRSVARQGTEAEERKHRRGDA